MNWKKTLSLAICILGILVVVFSSYKMHQLSSAKEHVNAAKNLFSDATKSDLFSHSIDEKIEKYHSLVFWMLICGITCTAFGGGLFLFYRKK